VPSYQALNSVSLASSTGLAQAMNIDFAIGSSYGERRIHRLFDKR
jgi:hypothetical protein